jgi:hypothetical protein
MQLLNQNSSAFLRNSKTSRQLPWIAFVLFYSIAANIPFWTAVRGLYLLPLGWFCLEYAVVGLIALFAPRILAALLLALVIFADLISSVSKTYYLTPSECLSNAGYLWEFPAARLLAMAGVCMLVLLAVAVAAFFPVPAMRRAHRLRAAGCLVVFILFCVALDSASILRETGQVHLSLGRPMDTNRYSDFHDLWLSRYPILRLKKNYMLFGIGRPAAPRAYTSAESATAIALISTALGQATTPLQSPNLAVVVVESWGLVGMDTAVRESLVQPYAAPGLLARYRVVQGSVPFHGSTVAGEARELCGKNMALDIIHAGPEELKGCLPLRLAARGYNSLAVHGLYGHMFDRETWYRQIGFQERWFEDRLDKAGLPRCFGGAFIGTCDAAIADWLAQRLDREQPEPQFLYWMTLNSHLPVSVPSTLPAEGSCTVSPILGQFPVLCSWYHLVFNVHDSVARMAMSGTARPTVFVVVGDHAPPFASPRLRGQFSDTVVPYILLIPRQGNDATGRP